jgi:hypothetical protein
LLEVQGTLPNIEKLEVAEKLHRAFSNTDTAYSALEDTTIKSPWTKTVSQGTACTPNASSGDPTSAKGTWRHVNGDRVLSNEIFFLRDGLMSREFAYTVAEGDVGRVYEGTLSLL